MPHKDAIEIENELSYKMLEEAVTNKDIKQALHEISLVLIENILTPLRKTLLETKQFSDLPKELQDRLQNLTAEHSAERRQYGAVMPEMESSQAILSSIDTILKLIEIQENYLLNIDKVKTVDEMAIYLKIIVELGYMHYEALKSSHRANFEDINKLIASTTEELDMRIFRSELNEPAKLALTHGIGTTENDLGLTSIGKGYKAGKAVFGMVSMKARLEILCQEYDKNPLEKKYADKMEYYKIPLNKNERKPLETYAKTFFEKLIKDPKTNETLPLIASVSRATTRIIVSLQDLEAFNKKDGSFDFAKAQMITNCIMGFIVHAGHHSFVEVAEVYNRLLDYVAIKNLEKNGPTPSMTEKNMPYYHLGNYNSFFNKSYADKLTNDEPVLRQNSSVTPI